MAWASLRLVLQPTRFLPAQRCLELPPSRPFSELIQAAAAYRQVDLSG